MTSSKTCFKCNKTLSLAEFYKHPKMGDGHLGKCKECTKRDTKENIVKNHDYYIEYDRNRANAPHSVEAKKKYSQTEIGKALARKCKAKWAENNVIKRAASFIINNAVRDCKIIKEYKCQSCGIENVKIHGHHDDYAFPMTVRWLCSKCHCAWHKLNGSGLNG